MELLHLQTAACGRPAEATIAAVADHLRLEAAEGGYVAEEQATPRLRALRSGVGRLLGHDPDAVFITTSATASLLDLLRRWPLNDASSSGAEVGVTPGEWGPNLDRFAERGLTLRWLAVDDDGVLDLDALSRTVRDRPPALIHLVALASHRALEQPVEEALVICRAAGVPLWVDAAQALAHRPTAFGADAVYAPARKWLDGPRGVGFLAVAEQWREPFAGLDDEEASVASWMGAAKALQQLPPDHVRQREEVGALLREAMAEVAGWEVADPAAVRGALVGLRPTAGQDVVDEQRRLYEEHRILTTACETWRAPGDMTEPLLRVATTALGRADVERLTEALQNAKHPRG